MYMSLSREEVEGDATSRQGGTRNDDGVRLFRYARNDDGMRLLWLEYETRNDEGGDCFTSSAVTRWRVFCRG